MCWVLTDVNTPSKPNTMPPALSLLPVEQADLPTLRDLVHSCKLPLAINRLIIKDWPNEPVQKRQDFASVNGAFESPTVEDLKLVDDETGDIIGCLVLRHDEAKDAGNGGEAIAEPALTAQDSVPEGVDPDVMKAMLAATATVEAATNEAHLSTHLPTTSRCRANSCPEIVYICVKQSRRRQGAGSVMMKACKAKARSSGLPLVICAEPAAVAFLTKQGFGETAHGDIDLSQFVVPMSGFGIFGLTGMIWRPED